jgi:hypothetical protein
MNPLLHIQLRIDAHQITINATGPLTALTAHLLPKVVIGALRRYPTTTLHLNLSAITAIDYVGIMAIEDCEFIATRRGVSLIITWEQLDQPAEPRFRSEARRAGWLRPPINTGTICRQRTSAH